MDLANHNKQVEIITHNLEKQVTNNTLLCNRLGCGGLCPEALLHSCRPRFGALPARSKHSACLLVLLPFGDSLLEIQVRIALTLYYIASLPASLSTFHWHKEESDSRVVVHYKASDQETQLLSLRIACFLSIAKLTPRCNECT